MPPRVRIVKTPGADAHIETLLRGVISRVADDIAEDAQRYAPKDTGRLANSIHVEQVSARQARVKADAPYAGYVEFGTENMAAQPFMRPALYKKRPVR